MGGMEVGGLVRIGVVAGKEVGMGGMDGVLSGSRIMCSWRKSVPPSSNITS